MKIAHRKLSRRKFLLAFGASGAAATVAMVAKPEADKSSKRTESAGDSKGYRLTEHVQKYYRTAKV